MELSFDKEFFIEILESVELKGKYFSSGSLKSDSLGEYVKIVPVRDSWRTGYFFMNGDNQTFVCYYAPSIIEEDEEPVVLEIPKLMKYLKTMSGRITLNIEELCVISSEPQSATIPVSLLHPNDLALSRLFSTTNDIPYSNDLVPISWGNEGTTSQFMIENGFQIEGKRLRKIMNSCESVGHGVYTFAHSNHGLSIMSSMGNEHYAERIEGLTTIGEASVTFTGPIHKALNDGSFNVYFNTDNLILLVSGLITIVRAPYVSVD
tara:strand:- start:4150 stop:4938 length:789 start_codon:yes stop_codon:yes gene_type:complete